MIRFTDCAGDRVEGGAIEGEYMLECLAYDDEKGTEYPVCSALDRAMARALAADLLAFADSAETEEGT